MELFRCSLLCHGVARDQAKMIEGFVGERGEGLPKKE